MAELSLCAFVILLDLGFLEGIPKLKRRINVECVKPFCRHLLSSESYSISAEVGRIRGFVTDRLGDLRLLLKIDAIKAKAELGKHVAGIRMIPLMTDSKKSHYEAEGIWNLLGGYSDSLANTRADGIRRIRVVAGARFELATFGYNGHYPRFGNIIPGAIVERNGRSEVGAPRRAQP